MRRARRLLVTCLLLAVPACGDDGPSRAEPDASFTPPPHGPHDAGVALPGGLVTSASGEECAACHADVVASFATSAMHESLTLPTGAPAPETELVGGTFVDGATGQTVRFEGRDGGFAQTVVYVDPTGVERATASFRVDLVIGSGHATRSYFEIRDGQFIELPLTWYRDLGTAAASPGAGFRRAVSRIATRLCVGCHTGEVTPKSPDADVGFEGHISLGITCARCHGDGAEHTLTGDPASVVDPAKLDPERQAELCAQCHLSTGFEVEEPGRTIADYRVGEPLADWIAVLDSRRRAPGSGSPIAGHGTRLRLSKCFTATAGRGDGSRLDCATCHDPHRGFKSAGIAGATARGCTVCHTESDCHAPMSARGEATCASCHMRVVPSKDIGHTRITDHWIRKRPQDEDLSGLEGGTHVGKLALEGGALVDLSDPDGLHPRHALRLAKGYLAGVETAAVDLGVRAVDWSARATAELDRFESANGVSPETEAVRGRLLTVTGRPAAALPLLERVLAARPDLPSSHAHLGYALTDLRRPADAVPHLAAAWRLQPWDAAVAAALAQCLALTGRAGEGLDVLEDLRDRLGPRAEITEQAIAIALASNDRERALRHAWDALLLAPRAPDALARAASLTRVLGREAELSRALVDEALRHAPDHVPALLERAEQLLAAGDRDAARADVNRAAQVAPDDPRIAELRRRLAR